MNYNLNREIKKEKGKRKVIASLRKLFAIIGAERHKMNLAFTAIILNAGLSLLGPYLLGYTIDTHVQTKNYQGVLIFAGILLLIYIGSFRKHFVFLIFHLKLLANSLIFIFKSQRVCFSILFASKMVFSSIIFHEKAYQA